MPERGGRNEQLIGFFRDGYIPKELDNPVVLGLLERVASDEIYMRMIDIDGATFINISPTTTARSKAEFKRIFEEFEADLYTFASIEQVKDTIPPTVIVLYPSRKHIEAISEAITLQRLLNILTLSEETRSEWKARIGELLQKYPRYNLQ